MAIKEVSKSLVPSLVILQSLKYSGLIWKCPDAFLSSEWLPIEGVPIFSHYHFLSDRGLTILPDLRRVLLPNHIISFDFHLIEILLF